MSKQQPLATRGAGQRRNRGYSEFDVETPKNPGPNPSTYPALTVGMTLSLMLGVTALLIGLGVGGFVGYFYDRENTRFGDIENTLASLQAQIDNKTAVTTFPDDLFAIFHGDDPSRRFCFDALQIGVSTKRTLTVQNSNGTIAYLADIPLDRAPNDATYLTLSTDGELTSERVLVMDAGNFDTSDFGPNAAFVVDMSDTGVVAATYSRATIEVDIKGRILSASSNAAGNGSMGVFIDDMFMVQSALESTRIVMLDVGSVSDSTTRVMTIPNLDGILALTAGTQTFTDKTLVGSSNTIEASAVRTTGAAVVFSGAAPPIAGQLPTATGPGAITWQTGATAVQTTIGSVNFAGAIPPIAGQVPTATGPGAITWQNPPAAGVVPLFSVTSGGIIGVGVGVEVDMGDTGAGAAPWLVVPVGGLFTLFDDSGGDLSLVTGALSIVTNGTYSVSGLLGVDDDSGTGSSIMQIVFERPAILSTTYNFFAHAGPGVGFPQTISGTVVVRLEVGDSVHLRIRNQTPALLTVNSASFMVTQLA